LATNLFAPIGNLILPVFATAYTLRDQRKIDKSFLTVSRFLIFVFIPLSTLIICCADLLIPVLYTTRYNESVEILKILTAFLFIDYIFSVPINTFLLANEKYRSILLVRLYNILFIPLIIIIINRFSITGVALVHGLFTLSSSLTLFIVSSKDIRISFPWAFFARTTISALIAGFLTKIFSFSSILTVPSLLHSIILFVLLFISIFKMFGGLEKEDKIVLSEMKFPLKRYVLKVV
jgi:O-antigen/teichoic acid export membrane protein